MYVFLNVKKRKEAYTIANIERAKWPTLTLVSATGKSTVDRRPWCPSTCRRANLVYENHAPVDDDDDDDDDDDAQPASPNVKNLFEQVRRAATSGRAEILEAGVDLLEFFDNEALSWA